ncbi:kinase domain protein [Ceratobasidium sp. AG-Ba]|nr:kinase domain protein [Ceratobasidium sp. AG-Ba]
MDQARLAVKANLDQYDSSDLARSSTWQRLQANPQTAILTGHTIDTAGDPVELYHPAFSAFLQNLKSPDRPDAETNDKFLNYRSNSLWSPLEDINHASMTLEDLGVLIGETFPGIKKSDKAFESAITEEGGACCIAIQARHGFGPNGEDPLVLAALAYAKYWTSRKVKGVFDTSCCPTLIVVAAGPWVCVFGGIFLAQPVVQRFTDMIQVSHNPSRPDDLGQLVRLFHSISIATQALRSFYLDSNYSRLDPSTRPFPYCTSYLDHDGHKVDYKYIKRLGSGGKPSTSQVFLAKALDSSNPKPIVVKFVERYNGQAHRLLAEQDLAPQLLYDGTTHSDGQIGSDYYMIVMDFVNGIRFDQLPPKLLSKEVTNSIEKALQTLHDADLVFGDLRPLNVMVLRDATGTPTNAQLVNFEWCGKHQEGRYPLRISRSFDWVSGVSWGGVMDKGHDIEMMKKLFSM